MEKVVSQVELLSRPPGLEACFDLIVQADEVAPSAAFGGAIRDADCGAYYGWEASRIKDYDIRVWLPADNHQARVAAFAARLGAAAGTEVQVVPSAGSGRPRYCLLYRGLDLDISIRPPVNNSLAVARVAIDRAGDSDAGLSSVAIAPDGTAWATAEYLSDRNNRQITIYPRPNSEARLDAYAARMQEKFPGHQVIRLAA